MRLDRLLDQDDVFESYEHLLRNDRDANRWSPLYSMILPCLSEITIRLQKVPAVI